MLDCMFYLDRWTQSLLIGLSSFDHYKIGTKYGFVYACEYMRFMLVYTHSYMFLFSFSLCIFLLFFFYLYIYTWKMKERKGDLISKESTNWMREIKWKKEYIF